MAASFAALVDLIYPPECAGCRTVTDAANGLCPSCWAGTSFITGPVCRYCGIPVPAALAGQEVACDPCSAYPRGWDRGAAAIMYAGTGKQIILRFKHGDRLDLSRPIATWMARAGAALLADADLIAPVPLHWSRLITRKYNQAAELARQVPIRTCGTVVPDLLVRNKPTRRQVALDRTERFRLQQSVFALNSSWTSGIEGRRVLLIDDVMTSGATLAGCTSVLRAAGVSQVDVLVAARVARDGFANI